VLVCRDDHPLARRKRLTWRQIQGYPLILGGHEGGHRPYLDAVLQAHDLRLRGTYEVQRSSTAVGMVAKGVAAAVAPGLAVQERGDPRLRAIPLTNPVVSRTLVLLTRRQAALSPAAQALYDMIRAG
jgi:DNA-binding transcriptional LysR family regulator